MKMFLFVAAMLIAAPALAQTKKPVKQEDMSKLSCEQQKRAYRESEACFNRYRDPRTKKLAPGAHQNCRELTQPQC
jgi:hypothetical protein